MYLTIIICATGGRQNLKNEYESLMIWSRNDIHTVRFFLTGVFRLEQKSLQFTQHYLYLCSHPVWDAPDEKLVSRDQEGENQGFDNDFVLGKLPDLIQLLLHTPVETANINNNLKWRPCLADIKNNNLCDCDKFLRKYKIVSNCSCTVTDLSRRITCFLVWWIFFSLQQNKIVANPKCYTVL